MAMQAIFTAMVLPQEPVVQTFNDIKYHAYLTLHPGVDQSIEVNTLAPVGSVTDVALEAFRKKAEANFAIFRKEKETNPKAMPKPVRCLFSGTNGTLNVESKVLTNAVPTKDKQGLTTGVVHKPNRIDIIVMSVRQTLLDTRVEPEQFTVTMIANCEPSFRGNTAIDVADGLQMPIQTGQLDAWHMKVLPDNPVVEKVLKGVGKAKLPNGEPNPDHIPPIPGIYFVSGTLKREAREAQPAEDGKAAFTAWDRIALVATTALPLQVQDMKTQKATNANTSQQVPDVDAFEAATEGENAEGNENFGVDLSNYG